MPQHDHPSSASITNFASKIASELLNSKVLSVNFMQQGMMNFKCHVETERGHNVIVRCYPLSRSHLIDQEPDLLLRCKYAKLPVPQLIGDSRSGPEAPFEYMVYHRINGDTLADALPKLSHELRCVLAEDLASHLNKLQRVSFDGWGELASGSVATSSSWRSFVEGSIDLGLRAIKSQKLLEPSLTRKIELATSSKRLQLPILPQQLIWGDINFENILVSGDGRVAGLIDFEGCLSGDHLATLGYAAAVHGTHSFFNQLRMSWITPISEDDSNLIDWYTLLRVMRLAPFAHLPLPTGRLRDKLVDIFPGVVPAIQRILESN